MNRTDPSSLQESEDSPGISLLLLVYLTGTIRGGIVTSE